MSSPERLFGSFRLNPSRRLLWERETPVQLGVRALAILIALTESPGELISKEVLFARAWPGLRVDDANLRVQISGLRKALKDSGNLIRAEASLGYRFVGEVATGCPSTTTPGRRRFRAPHTATTPIGREEVVKGIIDLLGHNRLLTILGSGGIGKTTVALTVASQLGDAYADGTCFVDLGQVTGALQVYAAVASSLDFSLEGTPNVEQVLRALGGRRMLLILDSCEHVTESVAHLVEYALSETSDIDILVTTRESLRITGEIVLRLDPLEAPPSFIEVTAANILQYSSVQLFMRTASQGAATLQMDDRTAVTTADICRRLDGIPLAIELAASMVGVLGIDTLRDGLDERFSVLSTGRRTAVPRQRSLAATIDWSYNLLPEREQAVLRRLTCFTGSFSLEAAIAVARDDEMAAASVRDSVLALANKSMLNVNHKFSPPEYRLLDMTRAYANQASGPAAENDRAKEHHARYFLNLLEVKNWDAYDPTAERMKMWGYTEEVRVALDWAFRIDRHLAVTLTLAAERLWLEVTFLYQGIHYLELALNQIDADPNIDPITRARVLVSLAAAQAWIRRPRYDEALFERAWRAAQATQDEFLQLRALFAVSFHRLNKRRPPSPYIEEFAAVAARSDDGAVQQLPLALYGYRDIEVSDVASASVNFESFITNCPYLPRKYNLYFGLELATISRTTFTVVKWYMGFCDQARSMFATIVEEAEERSHSTTLCFVLVHGAIWCEHFTGNFQRAGVYLRKLEKLSRINKPYQTFVKAYRSLLLRDEAKDYYAAERLLSEALQDRFIADTGGGLYPVFLFELADMRVALGNLDGAETILKQAITYACGDRDGRIVGKHHSMLANLLMARNRPGDMDAARILLKDAIDLTRLRGI
jgi:predicted ATPase/DNA-binding winged helix-turn-helix (wHTH) protein